MGKKKKKNKKPCKTFEDLQANLSQHGEAVSAFMLILGSVDEVHKGVKLMSAKNLSEIDHSLSELKEETSGESFGNVGCQFTFCGKDKRMYNKQRNMVGV